MDPRIKVVVDPEGQDLLDQLAELCESRGDAWVMLGELVGGDAVRGSPAVLDRASVDERFPIGRTSARDLVWSPLVTWTLWRST